jgi:hypothetical protein
MTRGTHAGSAADGAAEPAPSATTPDGTGNRIGVAQLASCRQEPKVSSAWGSWRGRRRRAAPSPRPDAPGSSSSGPGMRWKPRITGRGGLAASRRSARPRTPDPASFGPRFFPRGGRRAGAGGPAPRCPDPSGELASVGSTAALRGGTNRRQVASASPNRVIDMSSVCVVRETGLMGCGELSADDAWRAARLYGWRQLLVVGFVRFRYGDGFSHARAFALQLSLAAVPLVIAGAQVRPGGTAGQHRRSRDGRRTAVYRRRRAVR